MTCPTCGQVVKSADDAAKVAAELVELQLEADPNVRADELRGHYQPETDPQLEEADPG